MDPVRALFELFRLGTRFSEARNKLARATHTGIMVATLISLALSVAAVALCLLVYALDRALLPWLGEVGSALLLAFLLVVAAAGIYLRAHSLLKTPPPAPVAVPSKPEEMSTSALLALLGGIVVGTVLQARKDSREPL
jgi:hypothetical protein